MRIWGRGCSLLLWFGLFTLPALAFVPPPAGPENVRAPADRSEWLYVAQWYTDDHQPESLLALVAQTRAAHPTGEREAECIRFTAEAYRGRGRWDEAVAEFKKVITSYPNSDQAAWAQYGSGETHRAANKQADALAAFAEVRTRYPGTELVGWATLREGNILNLQGRVEDALAKYHEVADGWPGTQLGSRGQGYIAETYRDTGKDDQAATEYQRFIDQCSGIAYRSQIAKSHQFIAEIAERKGDYTTALQRYTIVVQQFSDTRITYDAYYGLLRAAKALGKVTDAVKLLEQATQTGEWKGRLAAMLVLQRAYDEQGSKSAAQQIRDRIKADFPASHEVDDLAHNMFWLTRRKGIGDPMPILRDGLLLNLSQIKKTAFMGEIGWQAWVHADYDTAIEAQRAILADPGASAPCKGSAQYDVVSICIAKRDFESAKKEYEILLAQYPDSPLTRGATRTMRNLELIPAETAEGGK